jgi:CPA2 family monovalent cation:H+ antiporter-2
VDHEPLLISTLAVGLTAALVGGLLARKLRLPPIVGYLLAGVVVGPFTPGFIADADLAAELAEIGVILLMFGAGIHLSVRDLLAVRGIAVPGALCRSAVATALGTALGLALGWDVGGALVLGLALSVASTVVLVRALTDRKELDSDPGRIAVGWVIVEDLLTILILVLLPAMAPVLGGSVASGSSGMEPVAAIVLALGKAAVFAALVFAIGSRFVPWLLVTVAREGSRELFTLGVLALAVGVAFASSAVFGVPLALGAFLAGAVVGESDFSHQAAADALPLRDAFAVLFFVSVGMLVDPAFLVAHPLEIAAVVALIVVAGLGHPVRTALVISAALAQIGEFSFIVATLGTDLGLLPADGFQLVVAGSLISITVNPLLFFTIEPINRRLGERPRVRALLERRGRHLRRLGGAAVGSEPISQHAIVCGYGRVGQVIAQALERRGFRCVVITTNRRAVEHLRREGKPALYGDASHADILRETGVERARMVIAAVNDPAATRLIVDHARALNPHIDVIARTHSDWEAERLRGVGPTVQAVFGERELAVQMLRYALRRYGLSTSEAELVAQGARRRAGPVPELGSRPGRSRLRRAREAVTRLGDRVRVRRSAAAVTRDAAPGSDTPPEDS